MQNLSNLGNSSLKVSRIMDAFRIAKHEHCGLAIHFNPVIYGKSGVVKCNEKQVQSLRYLFNEDTLTIIWDDYCFEYRWTDIIEINLSF